MEIPAPIVAFLSALPAKTPFRVEFDGWYVEIRATDVQGLRFSTPDTLKQQMDVTHEIGRQAGRAEEAATSADPLRMGVLAKELGITPDELAAAVGKRGRLSDVASLSTRMPSFEEDPLVPEAAGPGDAPLTDRARAEFLAATAPKLDAG